MRTTTVKSVPMWP